MFNKINNIHAIFEYPGICPWRLTKQKMELRTDKYPYDHAVSDQRK